MPQTAATGNIGQNVGRRQTKSAVTRDKPLKILVVDEVNLEPVSVGIPRNQGKKQGILEKQCSDAPEDPKLRRRHWFRSESLSRGALYHFTGTANCGARPSYTLFHQSLFVMGTVNSAVDSTRVVST